MERGEKWPILGQLNVFRPFSRMIQAPAGKKMVFLLKTPEDSTKKKENRSDTVKGALTTVGIRIHTKLKIIRPDIYKSNSL